MESVINFYLQGNSLEETVEYFKSINGRGLKLPEIIELMEVVESKEHFIRKNDFEFVRKVTSLFSSRTTLMRALRSLGLPPQHSAKVSYTKPIIWNEETLYIYGYFIGDGSLHECRSINGGQMDISSSDKQIIDDLSKYLNIPHVMVCHKTGYNDCYRISWTCKEWYELFLKCGIVTGKSNKNIRFWLPEDEKSLCVVLRGLIDSDGSISFYKNKGQYQYTAMFMGNSEFVTYLWSRLKQIVNFSVSLTTNRKLTQLSMSSSDSAKWLLDNVYNTTLLKLNRKYNKLVEYVNLKL